MKQFNLLDKINSPKDLRTLNEKALTQLASELREFLIESLDQCGGHFGSNLGVVELTIALHHIFNTPYDRLIWDVGHQAYPHKVLTGRAGRLHTIKQPRGLAPFPNRLESQYDAFGTGHSSTSISAALGMSLASNDPNQRFIAVIGDGGLTGGMAFEALNHAGSLDPNLIVILNDNDMSISANVGALTHYFSRILSSKLYANLRARGKKALANIPKLTKLAKKTEEHLKGMVMPGTLFEELGFHYTGPVDGHDLPELLRVLKQIKSQEGAQLVHVITRKGKGYKEAEDDPVAYHAVDAGFHSVLNQSSDEKGNSVTVAAGKPRPHSCKQDDSPQCNITYSDVFGQFLCDMARQDERLVGITPAMCEGSGMRDFAKTFPERFHDVGIAEQHAVTFACGLSCQGKKPVVAMYSSFLQRAYDQLIHDVALQNLDVTFALDRAGLVGPDGPTHSGSFDLSFLRAIPNLVIMAPKDGKEARQMLYTAYQYECPAVVRYPRGSSHCVQAHEPFQLMPIGQSEVLRKGQKIALLAFGSMVKEALIAAEELDATLINMRFIKPLDKKCLDELIKTHELIVTIEENVKAGGAGSAVNEYLLEKKQMLPILNLGLPDAFLPHGRTKALLSECGLDAKGIVDAVKIRS